jgi:hypothetical protein
VPELREGDPLFRAISRVVLAAVLGVLAPVTFAIPALAASPNVTLNVSASPSPSVSPGKAVMFIADLTYRGFSQSNHSTASASAPGGTFLDSWVGGVECGSQSCSLGSLAGSGTLQLLFLYEAPATGSLTGTVTMTTSESARGNTFSRSATVAVESNLDLGVAMLLPDASYPGFDLATVGTGLTGLISSDDPLTNNPHGTQLTFPGAAAQGTFATIQDIAAEDSPCPRSFKSASKCFGQGSYLSVLGGADVSPYLKVTAAWSVGELRNGVSEKTIQIVHIFGSTAQVISTICSSEDPGASELPCRTVGTLASDGTILVTSYVQHNGLIKGW